MKAVIHIGTEKTGTTSIQQWLHHNRGTLHQAGYHFLECAGTADSRAIAAYGISDKRKDDFFTSRKMDTPAERALFRQGLKLALKEEISALPPQIHTVIISSEHFHSRLRTPKDVARVYRLLSKHFDAFRVVCYLREQVDACLSYYSTHLKNGGNHSLAHFMRRCVPENYYFDYDQLLRNWRQCYGRHALEVALFPGSDAPSGMLLNDFLSRLDPALTCPASLNSPPNNRGLTHGGQALLRLVNSALPQSGEDEARRDLRDKYKRQIIERLSGSGRNLAENEALAIYSSFAQINERVRAKYFPQLERLFQPPRVTDNTDSDAREYLELLAELLPGVLEAANGCLETEQYQQLVDILGDSSFRPSIAAERLQKRAQEKERVPDVGEDKVHYLRDTAQEQEGGDQIVAAKAAGKC